jgi:hypothetical protein
MRRLELGAGLLAVVLVAGCHGPPIGEWDGGAGGGGNAGSGGNGGTNGGAGTSGSAGTVGRGGTTGAAGTVGRGGTTGAAGTVGSGGTTGAAGRGGTTGTAGVGGRGGTGGSGGAGCAAQMTPQMFHRGDSGPVASSGTSNRYYWAEYGQYITYHYSPGATPAENKHPFQIDASIAHNYEIVASDQLVAATWHLEGRLAVWGPDTDSLQMGGTVTLTYPSAIAVEGGTIFYSYQPTSGAQTPGIYQWTPSGAALLFESYTDLGGDRTLGLLLRVAPTRLLLSDKTDVWYAERGVKGVKQLLFNNPTTQLIDDVRPERPRVLGGGVLINLHDPILVTGRDYYVNLAQPGATPKDLSTATTALANASACGTAARYNGGGLLFNQRYVYEGNGGLFAVDVGASGGVSNLVRLTAIPLRYLEVTDEGDLFATWPFEGTRWDYYRVGRL